MQQHINVTKVLAACFVKTWHPCMCSASVLIASTNPLFTGFETGNQYCTCGPTLAVGALLTLPLAGALAAKGLMKGRACRPEGGGWRAAGAACGRGGKASCPLGETAHSTKPISFNLAGFG